MKSHGASRDLSVKAVYRLNNYCLLAVCNQWHSDSKAWSLGNALLGKEVGTLLNFLPEKKTVVLVDDFLYTLNHDPTFTKVKFVIYFPGKCCKSKGVW